MELFNKMADKQATTSTTSYRRASTFAPGIGKNLDEIQNQDVLLTDFSVGERMLNRRRDNEGNDTGETPQRGGAEMSTIVNLTIAKDISKPTELSYYHAWSDSLAEKVAEIPKDQLPLIIKFLRVQTTGGFRVWTFE